MSNTLGAFGGHVSGTVNFDSTLTQLVYRNELQQMQQAQAQQLIGARNYIPIPVEYKLKKEGFMGEIFKDLRCFVREHRSSIYTMAFVLVVDHLFFQGRFKATIQGLVDKLLKKVEAKIEATNV